MRKYYSVRIGKNKLDLPTLRTLFGYLYDHLAQIGYLHLLGTYASFGMPYENPERLIARRTKKTHLWPINIASSSYSEDDIFDVIEFLYDFVSECTDSKKKPLGDQEAGRQYFRSEINELLSAYSDGYELSERGEILSSAKDGLDDLFQPDLLSLLSCDPENVETQVHTAIRKFRGRHSSEEDKKDAVRDLADVLEFLRPKLKLVLGSKDESDLFNIANNFNIRHHRPNQKTNYDKNVWHKWMFYFYLTAIYTAIELIKKRERSKET